MKPTHSRPLLTEQAAKDLPEQISQVTIDVRHRASDAAEIPNEIAQIVELFGNELEGLAFPEVSEALLRSQVSGLQEARRAVAEALAALQQAEAEAANRLHQLGETAARGLAYAGIYAAADATRVDLAGKVAQLAASQAFGGVGLRSKTLGYPDGLARGQLAPKRRGRRPRSKHGQSSI